METIRKIGKIFEYVTHGFAWVSFAGVLAMMLLNVADVVLNKTINSPILGSYELTQRILMVTVFASFAYAQTKKTHINMTIIIVHFPRVLRYILFSIMYVLSIYIAARLCMAAWSQGATMLAKGMTTEVLYIPLYPFYYLESIAMGVFTLALVYDLVRSVVAIFSEEMAVEIQKEWT